MRIVICCATSNYCVQIRQLFPLSTDEDGSGGTPACRRPEDWRAIRAPRQCGFGLGDQPMKHCFRRLD
jgi:hypothetical protein